ncbi:gluconate 2-dehydrogenase subunit 3 family protein [Flavihumibacter profundi]|jgi:gluconate 2-dehydrogenase gamma chain|uniref:gluconate 2-dehydrogenase subunit 3 family protein n=1 Tax=Flavihumibacter profundi TaxID=2716883 RepID=UPI001CC58D1C|nr:gluconate 2-dehydrogenase subunit 3 family protein [Flavihumibacter profundi]MBZ5855675.1 gluconate 2-dehydrogenase subunit 3 family protein [Flavihumibacter profundi]
MDRRKSLKAIALGTLSTGILLDACKEADKKTTADTAPAAIGLGPDRMEEEKAYLVKLNAEKFFNDHELATITILGDIIIPKDEVSGSASDAKVTDFIEFIVKDMPEHQIPMRGGLRWLDLQCLKQFEKAFIDCSETQRIAMVDQIAYPAKAKPEMAQGVSFFNLVRDLVCTGFYTSEIGVKDIGYQGNKPNQYNGIPDDVLKQYKLAYTEKELKECISFNV